MNQPSALSCPGSAGRNLLPFLPFFSILPTYTRVVIRNCSLSPSPPMPSSASYPQFSQSLVLLPLESHCYISRSLLLVFDYS
jgi:hypothetical protein